MNLGILCRNELKKPNHLKINKSKDRYRQIDIHIDRYIDRQKDRQIDRTT